VSSSATCSWKPKACALFAGHYLFRNRFCWLLMFTCFLLSGFLKTTETMCSWINAQVLQVVGIFVLMGCVWSTLQAPGLTSRITLGRWIWIPILLRTPKWFTGSQSPTLVMSCIILVGTLAAPATVIHRHSAATWSCLRCCKYGVACGHDQINELLTYLDDCSWMQN
jgi:hypothetical protein